jgi:DNA-binding response OmpR family regulator
MLTEAGFEVMVAKDGTSAIHELKKCRGNVGLVVTDVDMGRMNGMELAETMRSQYPTVPILFVSGLPISTKELEKVAPGANLIMKPFEMTALIDAVRRAVGATP